MRARLLVFLTMLVCAGVTAAEPPRVVVGALPDWWPKSEFAYPSTMVTEDYGEARFRTGAREQDRATERGRHWHAYLVRTAPEMKEKAVDTNAKWTRVKLALESKGFWSSGAATRQKPTCPIRRSRASHSATRMSQRCRKPAGR